MRGVETCGGLSAIKEGEDGDASISSTKLTIVFPSTTDFREN